MVSLPLDGKVRFNRDSVWTASMPSGLFSSYMAHSSGCSKPSGTCSPQSAPDTGPTKRIRDGAATQPRMLCSYGAR